MNIFQKHATFEETHHAIHIRLMMQKCQAPERGRQIDIFCKNDLELSSDEEISFFQDRSLILCLHIGGICLKSYKFLVLLDLTSQTDI